MINEGKITAKQALKEIKFLKVCFMGTRDELHNEIDKIIDKVK